MKLGISLIIIGGLLLGANLLAALWLASIGEGIAYMFTGLALPGLLLLFGVSRIMKVKHESQTN